MPLSILLIIPNLWICMSSHRKLGSDSATQERGGMIKKFFVLTGAPGSGKSTIVTVIQHLGFSCIEEPARQILAEQRSINSAGLPEKDPRLFTELMLSRSIYQYKQMA